MKLILLSDLHLRSTNPSCRTDDFQPVQWAKLEYVFEYAFKNNHIVLQAGDVFNSTRDIKALSTFIDLLHIWKINFITIFGQHDMYMRNTDYTNLEILNKTDMVRILDNDMPYLHGTTAFYGCSWNEKIPNVENKEDTNILVIHKDISDNPLWPGHEYTHAGKFLKKYKDFDLILCGDIHKSCYVEVEKRRLINTGPLTRQTADKHIIEHNPHFIIYDTETKEIEIKSIPHEDGYKIISREKLDRKKVIDTHLNEFAEALESDFEAGVNLKENIIKYIKENKIEQDIIDIMDEEMQNE